MYEPTNDQCERLRETRGRVALAHFYTVRDAGAFASFYERWSVEAALAQGHHGCRSSIDFSLIGPAVPFTQYVVDVFPSGQRALNAFDAVAALRAQAFGELLVLTLHPGAELQWQIVESVAKGVHLFTGRSHRAAKDLPLPKSTNAAIDPTPERFERMLSLPQDVPITMLNLNRFAAEAHYPEDYPRKGTFSGRTAYSRYSRAVVPHLLKRGAYPVWSGKVSGVLVGDEQNILAQGWDDFIVNTYPSRLALRDMITDPGYQRTAVHREAALDAACVLQGEPLPL